MTQIRPSLFFSIMVSAAMALAPASEAFAAGIRVKNTEELTKLIFENVKSRQHVINTLESAGVTIESMKYIKSDLQKRIPTDRNFPKFKIIKNRLFANDKKTPVHFVSYEPLKIGINGRTWSNDTEKLQDENYKSLARILDGTNFQVHNSLDWLIASAHAQETTSNMTIGGAIFGTALGLIVAVANGKNKLAGAMIGGGLGAVIGNISGSTVNGDPSDFNDSSGTR